MHRAEQEAQERALKQLDLVEFNKTKTQLQEQIKALEEEKEQLIEATAKKLSGCDLCGIYYYECHIQERTASAKASHLDAVLAESEAGREIVRLRQEKDEMLDTIWLATSPRQISGLWIRFCELIGDEPTALQQQALQDKATE